MAQLSWLQGLCWQLEVDHNIYSIGEEVSLGELHLQYGVFESTHRVMHELKRVGCTAKDLKLAGFTPHEFCMAMVGYEFLLEAGFTPQEMCTGFQLELKRPFARLQKLLGDAIRRIGVTVAQLFREEFPLCHVIALGFPLSDIAQVYPLTEVRQAGFNADEFRRAGLL